jgi:lipoprotein NlpD
MSNTLDPKYRILRWLWPANGPIIQHFTGKNGNNGVDISGRKGTLIRAAANGVVVYAGSGLRGYGQLLIIQHNEVFLSAYAHNQALLVGEGATVRRGQTVAEMGDTDAESPRLHFEIRRDGKPVNPLDYLPDKSS